MSLWWTGCQRRPLLSSSPWLDPGVGKTTLIKSLIKRYTKHNLSTPTGPLTAVTSKKRPLAFTKCHTNSLTSIIEVSKITDIVLLMIDGNGVLLFYFALGSLLPIWICMFYQEDLFTRTESSYPLNSICLSSCLVYFLTKTESSLPANSIDLGSCLIYLFIKDRELLLFEFHQP